MRIVEYVAAHGIEGDGPHKAVWDSLLKEASQLRREPVRQEGKSTFPATSDTKVASQVASQLLQA